jgi:hypothetical protein
MTYPDGIDALVNVNATDSLAAGGHAARHNSVNTALVEVKDYLVGALGSKASLSGASFTGDVDVKKSTPIFSLEASASGQAAEIQIRTGSSRRWAIRKNNAGESGSDAGSDLEIVRYSDANALLSTPLAIFRSNALTRMSGVQSNTTANAANVQVSANGDMLRSTSSIKYKTDVETLDIEHADKVLQLRPVWYRSTSEHDKPEWSHYGLIAEEVAEIDPRLVSFMENEDGTVEPEGVQYDRLVPHLISVVQRQRAEIDALTARLDAAGI